MSNPGQPRVLLLIPHLGGGGAERVIETLARSLNPGKYDLHLGLITSDPNESHRIPETVTIHELRAIRVRHSFFKLVRLIWRLRPRLILSGIAHLNLFVLALKPLLPRSSRVLVRHNGTIDAIAPSKLSRRLYSLGYRRADRVICQTESMRRQIHRSLGVKLSKLLVLSNPTNVLCIRSQTSPDADRIAGIPVLLSIGRLAPEKGFDILLDAFGALSPPFRFAELVLAGSGPLQSCLYRQSRTLGIQDRVHFEGHVPDPVIQFRHASLFVLSSRTEGLPNALLEAAAAGLPIVSTPASAGLVDLLQDREGVWLATETSPNALRVAIEHALVEIHPGQRYAHSWIEPYDISRSIPAYEAAMDHVIAGSVR